MENVSASSNRYKTMFFMLLASLAVVAAFAGGVWYQSQQTKVVSLPKEAKPEPKPTRKLTVVPSTKAEKDLPPMLDLAALKAQADQAIKAAFAAKYSRPIAEVHSQISAFEPSFAKGGVRFGDEMGGGWFLAAEVGGEWVIIDDGNGTVSCEKIEPYNFPVNLVSECWSETTQEIVYR